MPPTKQDKFNFWEWLRDKVMPSLIVTICIGMFMTYVKVVQLTDSIETTKARVTTLENKVDSIQEAYVKRSELLEIMKRIEQQQELILLKSKIDKANK